MKPVMILKNAEGTVTVEVYLLNVGETFERFGGSSRGLTVIKTASLITRTESAMHTSDKEWDLADAEAWAWIRRLMTEHGFEISPGTL